MKKFFLCLSASLVAVVLLVSPLYAEDNNDMPTAPSNCCKSERGTDPGW